jgi:hypothetical protein
MKAISTNVWGRIAMVVLLTTILVFGGTRAVHAAEVETDGIISANETIDDDVLLTGNTIRMDGTVNGILLATGGSVTINGTINGDAFLFGDKITLNEGSVITGNLFVGASNITMDATVLGSVFTGGNSLVLGNMASVARNLYFGGYSLETATGSSIGTDLLAGGYQLILNGIIGRDLQAGAGAIELNGTVGRNARLEVASPGGEQWTMRGVYGVPQNIEPGLRISEDAVINGKLVYTSPVEQGSTIKGNIAESPVYQTPIPERSGTDQIPYGHQPGVKVEPTGVLAVHWIWQVLRDLITLFALGALALWLIPGIVRRIAAQLRAQPVQSLGYGFLVVLLGFTALAILPWFFVLLGLVVSALSLGGLVLTWFVVLGLVLTLIVALFLFMVFTGSVIFAAYAAGEAILSKTAEITGGRRYVALLLGVFLYVLASSVPLIGWLISILASLIGLGAMWNAYRAFRGDKKLAKV